MFFVGCNEFFVTEDSVQSARLILGENPQVLLILPCDLAESGWVLIQQRINGEVNFTRNFQEYQTEFGSTDGNYWMGLDQMHVLTQPTRRLRIYLESYDPLDPVRVAIYDHFSIGNSSSNYRLSVGGYSGSAGDSFSSHTDAMFSAYDKDNDKHRSHCAYKHLGGWWYAKCFKVNLNGHYRSQNEIFDIYQGIQWTSYTTYTKSLKRVAMYIL